MNKIIYDLEVSPNYFLIGMLFENGKVKQYEAFGKNKSLKKKHIKKIKKLLSGNTFVGFNNIGYDNPILGIALDGEPCKEMFKESCNLIQHEGKHWHYTGASNNQIDLIEVAKGAASLKLYAARLGAKKLQDLPYAYDKKLTRHEADEIAKYNINDLEITKLLYDFLLPQLDIRDNIGKQYGIDVMSRSDAQVAEDVFKKDLGIKKKPNIDKPEAVTYTAPEYVKFKSDELTKLKEKFETTVYDINGSTGKFIAQEWLKDKITIAGIDYTIGYGGLHSNEKSMSGTGDIKNEDIASMYPSLI